MNERADHLAMTTEPDLEARWREREAWWRRKLG